MFHTKPENAADLEILKEMLRELPIGETLEYVTMTNRIGRNVRDVRWILDNAITSIEEETGGLFETVRGVGIKRMKAEAMPDVGLQSIRKIKRAAKRGYARLDGVRANDMSASDRWRLISHKSQLGAISLVADGRRTATVQKEVAQTGKTVPAGRVLDMFKDKE